jgi:uncharacterized protein YqjF (DUF2071 family)
MSFLLAQTWRDLLFAHWPVPASKLASYLPPGLSLDRFSGECWLTIAPFLMTGIRFRGTPNVPYLSRTLELNLRTYVSIDGRPGIFFFSLDAASPIAVLIARRFFHLPYFHAAMSSSETHGLIDYRSARRQTPATFHARYRPTGPVTLSKPGTIDHFLTERYCFYTANPAGAILRGDIAHEPWPLQPAEAEFLENGLTLPWKIELPDTPPLLHFAKRLDVRAQRVRKIDADRRV